MFDIEYCKVAFVWGIVTGLAVAMLAFHIANAVFDWVHPANNEACEGSDIEDLDLPDIHYTRSFQTPDLIPS